MKRKINLLPLCAYLLLLESRHFHVWAQLSSESCSGRCGQPWSLPCSCHETCVVYNNCCEDINQQCPQIMRKSQAKFDKHVPNHVECSDNGVFMIAGCMSPSDQGQNDTTPRSVQTQDFPVTPEETSVINKISDFIDSESIRSLYTMLSSEDESMRSLGKTFMSAPVTDASTGLVYTNFTVFSCDATNESVPHIWKASVNVEASDGLNNVQELSNVLDTAKVVYTPPDQMSSFSHCRPDCIDHCEKEVDDETTDLRDNCEHGGFTYVTVKTEPVCYKNMYCGQCKMNESFIPLKRPYSGKTTGKLSVLMSLSEANLKLSLGNKRSGFYIPWEEKTCPLEQISAERDDDVMKCRLESCAVDMVKRPDGECRFPVSDKFAVADDDTPLTADDIKILPKFVQCLIKEALHDEIVLVRPDVDTVHDRRLNTTIHITYIKTFAKYKGLMLNSQQNVLGALVKLTAIAKSFQRYRQTKRTPTGSKDSEKAASMDSTRDDSHTSNTVNPKIPSLTSSGLAYVKNIQDWDRGAVVDNVTITTTCFCRAPVTLVCNLTCVQDPWYIEEADVISEFLDLPCLADVETQTRQKKNQADTGQKRKIWALVFIMICMHVIIIW